MVTIWMGADGKGRVQSRHIACFINVIRYRSQRNLLTCMSTSAIIAQLSRTVLSLVVEILGDRLGGRNESTSITLLSGQPSTVTLFPAKLVYSRMTRSRNLGRLAASRIHGELLSYY
jgi:hypothetical protein